MAQGEPPATPTPSTRLLERWQRAGLHGSLQEVWIGGFQRLPDRRLMLAEAERKEIRVRTSLESVVLTLASRRIME